MTKEKTQEKEKEQSLANFDWDNENSFFGIQGTGTDLEEEEVITKVKEDESEEDLQKSAKTKPKPKAKEAEDEEEEEVEEDEVPFAKINEDGDDEPEDDDDDDEPETLSFEDVIKTDFFKTVQIPEGEELTKERMAELVEEQIDAYVEEAFNSLKEEGGDELVNYTKFLAAGGNPIEYHRLWKEAADAPLEADVENDDGQTEIIRYYLKNYTQNNSKEDINDHLEWLEEKGKKKAYAEKYKKVMDDDFEERKKELLENQRKEKVRLENGRKEAAKKVKDVLTTSEKIGNIIITKEDKTGTLYDDITKASVKIGDNRYITPLQSKIGEAFKDPEKLVILAKLVMSDFDMEQLEVEAATKVAKNVKKTIVAQRKQLSSTPKKRVRKLSDFFAD